jgi:hypothetical protein
MTTRAAREFLAILETEGVKILSVTGGGPHIIAETDLGKVPISATKKRDPRAFLNFRTTVRAAVRAGGFYASRRDQHQ